MVKKIISNPLVAKLINLSEKELTEKVIMPVLEAIKYSKVEYFGGVYEEGKDIICWGVDEFEQTFLAVAQVKKYKPTAVASDDKSFGEVITQLSQCIEIVVPNIDDGKEYIPDKIYFFTPYPIDTRALKTRFKGYRALKERQVQIIDGDFLAKQVEKLLPDVLCELMGGQQFLKDKIVESLDNKALLNALQFNSFVDLSKIYSDLDFCLGGVSSTNFISYKFSPKKTELKLEQTLWEEIKERSIIFNEEIKSNIFLSTIEDIEKNYEEKRSNNNSIRSKIKKLNEIKSLTSKEIDGIHKSITKVIDKVTDNLDEKKLKGHVDFKNYNTFIDGNIEDNQGKHEAVKRISQKEEIQRNKAISYFENKFFKESNYENLLTIRQDKLNEIDKINLNTKLLIKGIQEQVYIVELNSKKITDFLFEKQQWLKRKAKEFNANKTKNFQLRVFMQECHKLFDLVEKIISDPFVKQAVSFDGAGEEYSSEIKSDERFTMSVHSIFDTGLDVILLGGAGAGKTTSLQMYTKYQLENTPKMVFYIPLARVLSSVGRTLESNISPVDYLQKAILSFINIIGNKISKLEFEKILSGNKPIFLFDGIDEVIGSYSWIIGAIKNFGNRYQDVQLVISSRFGGKYFDDLKYLSVQLLPFTNEQRERFFYAWFENNESVNSSELLAHIGKYPEIGEIVRTPLLATIMCVLAEFKVPLPESEVRLYEERMKLLLGHYDTHKGIKRIQISSQILDYVARKIAFDFHQKSIRHLSYDRLINKAITLCKEKYSEEIVIGAINELIDPCNVIVAMTNDGALGFGHTRHQEYLAAKELVLNRGVQTIVIRNFLHDPSWRGALVLFSQMTDDLEFLVNDLVYGDNVRGVYGTLILMLEARPQTEKTRLIEIVKQHLELDLMDDILMENKGALFIC